MRWRIGRIEGRHRSYLSFVHGFEEDYFKAHGEFSCPKNDDRSSEKRMGGLLMRFEECSKAHYIASVIPDQPGTSGPRAFCIDEMGTVKWFVAGFGTCKKDGKVWSEETN